jgi:transcriptional regulator with XRE-family HTH domain
MEYGASRMKRASFSKLLTNHLTQHPELTNVDVARRCGVSPSTVGYWINHGAIPSPDHIPALADLLGIDEAELWRLRVPRRAGAIERRSAVDVLERIEALLIEIRDVVVNR